ncbi:MAG: hypothetical protein ACN6OP_07510 [Pseudomonadales bacterium]
MTDQNNAAQAATQPTVLTREEVGELYKDWVCVFGVNAGSAELCIREIETAVLSKLRAPVAEPETMEESQPIAPDDEAISECWISASDSDGIAYDGPSFERGYHLGEIAERDRQASAPVAGERAKWQNAQRIVELPAVDKALANFCDDGTQNNAVLLVLAILDAAPQTSAAITHYECGPYNGDGTYEAVPVYAAPPGQRRGRAQSLGRVSDRFFPRPQDPPHARSGQGRPATHRSTVQSC